MNRILHVIAALVALAGTLCAQLVRQQNTTLTLPAGRWHNALTSDTVDGGEVRLAELLGRAPVALLAKEGDGV